MRTRLVDSVSSRSDSPIDPKRGDSRSQAQLSRPSGHVPHQAGQRDVNDTSRVRIARRRGAARWRREELMAGFWRSPVDVLELISKLTPWKFPWFPHSLPEQRLAPRMRMVQCLLTITEFLFSGHRTGYVLALFRSDGLEPGVAVMGSSSPPSQRAPPPWDQWPLPKVSFSKDEERM